MGSSEAEGKLTVSPLFQEACSVSSDHLKNVGILFKCINSFNDFLLTDSIACLADCKFKLTG